MSGLAEPGHGTLLGVNTVAAEQVFNNIAELIDIKSPPLIREVTITTPHNLDIDCKVLGVAQRGPVIFMVNYKFSEVTHIDLITAWAGNTTLGWVITAPTGTPGAGEWIMSGAISLIDIVTPVRTGQITAAVTVEMSGNMIIDGNEIGDL